jgi:hypothetical protein
MELVSIYDRYTIESISKGTMCDCEHKRENCVAGANSDQNYFQHSFRHKAFSAIVLYFAEGLAKLTLAMRTSFGWECI